MPEIDLDPLSLIHPPQVIAPTTDFIIPTVAPIAIMSSEEAKLSSPPLDHLEHRDSLKRPRSDSSDADPSPEPVGFPAQAGVRYGGKDSLVCDQCGVAFRKHSDLK